ncbi:DinB family protein [Priestia aryabhattai]|uniref:DinB family protein n=2 Tax=Priestia TaxID=2800373 RepID=UPI003D2C9D24
MNSYCERVFNQIQVNIRSVTTIINDVTEEELAYRPLPHKRSIQELLQHLCLICTADYHISLGYSADKMNDFYLQHPSYTKLELKAALIDGFNQLKAAYSSFDERKLFSPQTSYWGCTYTHFEWLLEIQSHLYHHRAELYTLLTCYRRNGLDVVLFE